MDLMVMRRNSIMINAPSNIVVIYNNYDKGMRNSFRSRILNLRRGVMKGKSQEARLAML